MAGIGRPKGSPKTPGSGRKKGVTNGDTAKLRELILGALDDVGGRKYLAAQALENPAAFMTLIGKVLPKDVNVGGQPDNPVVTEIRLIPMIVDGDS
ncbi:MAG: hypothetical protein WAW41_01075 [Methylobacter sp.]